MRTSDKRGRNSNVYWMTYATAYNVGSDRPGSNSERNNKAPITGSLHRAHPSLYPSGVVLGTRAVEHKGCN